MALARDEKDAIKMTSILAGCIFGLLAVAWTIAFVVW